MLGGPPRGLRRRRETQRCNAGRETDGPRPGGGDAGARRRPGLAQDSGGTGEAFTATAGPDSLGGDGERFALRQPGGDDFLFSAEEGEILGDDDVQGGSGNDACAVDEQDEVSNCENLVIR